MKGEINRQEVRSKSIISAKPNIDFTPMLIEAYGTRLLWNQLALGRPSWSLR